MPGVPIQTGLRHLGDGAAGLRVHAHGRRHWPCRHTSGLLAAHSFRVDLGVTGQRHRHIQASR